MNIAFYVGFIKRAMEHGLSEKEAEQTLQEYFNSSEYRKKLTNVRKEPILQASNETLQSVLANHTNKGWIKKLWNKPKINRAFDNHNYTYNMYDRSKN